MCLQGRSEVGNCSFLPAQCLVCTATLAQSYAPRFSTGCLGFAIRPIKFCVSCCKVAPPEQRLTSPQNSEDARCANFERSIKVLERAIKVAGREVSFTALD